ncbi:MAG: hypothetical protein J6R79_02130 [Bacteroidaceae bacterium]|nr:hypothetical protein [Bacteroidaceae bacterium]
MKKTYNKPSVQTVELQSQSVLAASVPVGGTTDRFDSSEFDFVDDKDWK